MCDQIQTFDGAYEKSSAIFLGEVVDTKQSIINTTHHGKSEKWDVKFKVLKSWRLINREYVWSETSGKYLQCGSLEVGKMYLVYANQSNSKLFVHPDSRTMLIGNTSAENDLKKLGNNTLTLREGEFKDNRTEIYGFSIVFLLIVTFIIFIYCKKRGNQI